MTALSLSSEERKHIERLRNGVAVELAAAPETNFTDFDFLRWLQGFNFDHDAVTPILKQHLVEYSLWHVDKAVMDPVVKQFYPKGMMEIADKNNYFLYIETIGLLDTNGLWNSCNWLTILRSLVSYGEWNLRKIREQEAKTGKQSWIIFVQDLDKMSWDFTTLWNMVSGPYKWLGDYWAQHYVETMKQFIIINAPSIIYYLWTAVKMWLPQRTRGKIIILGTSYREELLRHVDADLLPRHWGGNQVDSDGDEMCRSQITVPTMIPKELYWKSETEEDNNMSELIISGSRREFVNISLTEGMCVTWQFMCSTNFSFTVYFLEPENNNQSESNSGESVQKSDELKQVYPFFRNLSATVAVPESDTLYCARSGVYRFLFENCNRWKRLHVHYAISVIGSETAPASE